MNHPKKPLKVIFSPLDWGLGHATRSVPLIRFLLQKGCHVILAADEATARLLKSEFPDLEVRFLKGYHIRYGNNGVVKRLLVQLPGIFKSIKRESNWLQKVLEKESFDLVISDNRPGFCNKKVHSVYITHQLSIQSGRGKFLDRLLQKLHFHFYKKFHSVWVPDTAGEENLSGALAHMHQPAVQPNYIGLWSRFDFKPVKQNSSGLLILLSGPEPQRSVLEQKIINGLNRYSEPVILVRGLPASNEQLTVPSHIEVFNHLSTSQLQQYMLQAQYIICRSGYSTVMDLIALNRKAILVPTPGQTEQEYLARYLLHKGYFPFVLQKEFDAEKALNTAAAFTYKNPFSEKQFTEYYSVIENLLFQIQKHKSRNN